jgi:hypothetical protein
MFLPTRKVSESSLLLHPLCFHAWKFALPGSSLGSSHCLGSVLCYRGCCVDKGRAGDWFHNKSLLVPGSRCVCVVGHDMCVGRELGTLWTIPTLNAA